MYIAMNRFRIRTGCEAQFEEIWRSRDTRLANVPGVVEFHLLRGPAAEDHTLFASHTVWETRAAFDAWTRSEAFREVHRNAGDHRHIYLEGPHFEGFEVVQHLAFT